MLLMACIMLLSCSLHYLFCMVRVFSSVDSSSVFCCGPVILVLVGGLQACCLIYFMEMHDDFANAGEPLSLFVLFSSFFLFVWWSPVFPATQAV